MRRDTSGVINMLQSLPKHGDRECLGLAQESESLASLSIETTCPEIIRKCWGLGSNRLCHTSEKLMEYEISSLYNTKGIA